MCSCSGNCNCNSSTIPRGPSGPQGPVGPAGTNGTAATITVGDVTSGTPASVTNSGTSSAAIFDFVIPPGSSGNNGINAYSQVNTTFTQPADNDSRLISVQNNTWMAPGQIIYIGPGDTSNPGGYYKVNFLIGGSITQVNVTKLDWIDPNTTFVPPAGSVEQGSIVVSAGIKGSNGPQGPPGPVIIDSQWNASSFGTGRINSLKTSIPVAPSYMSNNDDALEIQAIFVVEPNVTIDPCAFYLRMSNVNSSTTPLADVIAQYTPTGGTVTTLPSEYFVVHVNCKLQRVGNNRIAVKSEWYSSKQTNSVPFYINNTVDICMNSLITSVYTLSNSNTFNSTQFIMACADDNTELSINGRHLEVKSFKKF